MKKICPVGHFYSGSKCNQCGKTSARGYDHRWRRLSERYRTIHPLCEDCDKDGLTMAAEEVHHIVPICEAPHLRLDVKNLVALCKKCHRKRHGSEEK